MVQYTSVLGIESYMLSMVRLEVKIWEFETENAVQARPTIGSDGMVYVGSKDNKLYAINGKTGIKIWEFETGGKANSSPAIGSRMVQYTSDLGIKSYMPSMLKRGSSSGNLIQKVLCNPPQPSAQMAPFTSGHMTTNSMPSMVRRGTAYGNFKLVMWYIPPLPSA